MLHRQQLLPGVWFTGIRSHKFKTACFSVNLLRPLGPEAARNALIPSVLLRGCGDYPNIQAISTFLEGAYGASVGTIARKKGEIQLVGLYADFIEDSLVGEPMLETMAGFVGKLLSDPVLVEGGFDPEAFAGERENLLNSMAGAINDKRVYAVKQLLKTMCKNEAYATAGIGEEADLEGVTEKNLLDHYRQLLATSPMEIFYMGSLTGEDAAAVFRRMLDWLPPRQVLSLPPAADVVPGEVRVVTEVQSLVQSKLCIGCRMPRPQSPEELAAAQLFLAVFGAGTSSKLFVHVREEQSLCYYASASFDRLKGLLLISSGIDSENFDTALAEIRRQLAACAAGDITPEELRLARTQLLSNMRATLDSPGRLEEFYTSQALGGGATVQSMMEALENVTLDQVVAVARSVREDTVYFLKGVRS